MSIDNNQLEKIGKALYNTSVLKEYKRYVVFRTRCLLHKRNVEDILGFFAASPERIAMLEGCPALMEQTTRAFFYKGSTWDERVDIVKNHVEFLEQHYNNDLLAKLYCNKEKVILWEDSYLEKPLQMSLWFHAGQRKEGSLSLTLTYEEQRLYQIMFWIGKDMVNKDKYAIYIGALQGVANGSDIIKGLTKAFFGYRTKNLIFYGLRSVAKAMDMDTIYAVGNEGYYAMNHIRRDRKLKTDFGAFWKECEGAQCSDQRFYVMPVAEYRKAMEELKPSKRAQHRRRFAKMDEMEASVAERLQDFKKNK